MRKIKNMEELFESEEMNAGWQDEMAKTLDRIARSVAIYKDNLNLLGEDVPGKLENVEKVIAEIGMDLLRAQKKAGKKFLSPEDIKQVIDDAT